MPDDRVQVQIIADSSGYQSGAKAAATATDQLKASAAQMAEALRQAGGDLSKVSPALLGIGGAAKEAATALSATAPAARATGEAVASTHGSISTATREFRALFDELSSGRTRQTPGTLAIIAQRVFGLGPAALGAVAGVAALAGGLGYLAVKAAEAANALDSIQIGAAFSGDLALTKQGAEQLVGELEKLGESSGNAQKIINAFARVRDITNPELQTLTALVRDYAAVTGDTSDKAAEALAKMFSPGESATKLVETLSSVSDKVKNEATIADKSGESQAIFAAKIDALSEALGRAKPAIDEHSASIWSSISSVLGFASAASEGVSADQYMATSADLAAQARKRLTDALNQSSDAVKSAASSAMAPAPSLATMSKGAEGIGSTPGVSGADAARQSVQYWQSELETAEKYGGDIQGVMEKLNQARTNLARVGGEQAIEAAREAASQLAATESASAVNRLTAEAGVWRALLAGDRLTADQRVEAQRTLNETLAELGRAQIAQATKNADEETATLRKQYEAQMEIARKGAAEIKRLNEEQERFNKEQAQQSARDWNEAFNAINGSVSTFLSDVISKHETAAAAKSAVDKLVTSWITGIAEIMLKVVAFEALQAASGLGGMIGGLAQSGANALGGAAAVAPSAAGAGSEATGLAAILPAFLSRLLGIGTGVGGAAAGAAGSAASTTAQTATLTANTLAQTASLTASATAQTAALTAAQTATQTASDATLSAAITASDTALGASITGAIAVETTTLNAELIALNAKPSILGTSYAVGTASVPHDMLAMVHKGEIVIPADISAQLRSPSSMTVMGASAGNAGGGGAAPTGVSGAAAGSVTHNWNISAIDGASVQAFFNKYGTTVARTVSGVSAANPSIAAPAY